MLQYKDINHTLWTHVRQSIPRSHIWVRGCLLWVILGKISWQHCTRFWSSVSPLQLRAGTYMCTRATVSGTPSPTSSPRTSCLRTTPVSPSITTSAAAHSMYASAPQTPRCNLSGAGQKGKKLFLSWWRHQMETFSALLAIYAGNSTVTGEFPAQKACSFDFFYLRLNKRLSKQPGHWWFETPLRPL